MRTHFVLPGNRKMRLGRNLLGDVLSRRMALITHNLHSGRLKNDFGEVEEAMFQSVERTSEVILCILSFEKMKVEEVFFKKLNGPENS
jgi:hypothetical protein